MVWSYGETGVGKTRAVYARYPIDEIYVKDESKWWDGYRGQQVILFDDFRGQIPFNVMLRILDRYPYAGQVKGGYCNINSPVIVITSSLRPNKVYMSDKLQKEDSLKQLLRRIDYVYELRRNGDFHEVEEVKESCIQECMPLSCVPTFNIVNF